VNGRQRPKASAARSGRTQRAEKDVLGELVVVARDEHHRASLVAIATPTR
jgi:hypothetical protein